MTKRVQIILLIALVLILVGIAFIAAKKHRTSLPSDFTVSYTQDATSSGAERTYAGQETFVAGYLSSGAETYDASGGEDGGWTIHTECAAKGGEWVDATTGADCTLATSIPLTREELMAKTASGDIVAAPESECPHLKLCYVLTPSAK